MSKNVLKVLSEQELLGNKFRIYGTYEEPLFLAKDVAGWIEHNNVTLMLNNVGSDEKKLDYVLDISGQRRKSSFLTENGVYEVIMLSRKPIAKTVKKQFKAILHSVRVNGGYVVGQEELTPDQLMAKVIIVAQNVIKQKEIEIEELKPLANYCKVILQNKGLVNITQIAKDYGMSANEMNIKLHDMKIQFKSGGQWVLYKSYQNKGYVHSETFDFKHKDGTSDVNMLTKWTQKGRLFLYDLLKENGIIPVIERGEIQ